MNGFGVAIASDSAVTMGDVRTYDTAEKVVPLELPHRIAVLHSGRVRIGNLPYSVLVGEWSRQLGNKPLRNSEAYQIAFQDWLANNQQWFDADAVKEEILSFVRGRAENLAGKFEEIRADSPDYVFDDLLAHWTNEVTEADRLHLSTPTDTLATMAKYEESISEIFESVVAPLSSDENLREKFDNYCAQYFSSAWMTNATLTFTGYGEHEIYPSYSMIQFQGFVDGRLRWAQGESYGLSPKSNPLWAIALPAQRDAIDHYLMGYDEEMLNVVIKQADHEKIEVLSQIRDKFDDDPSVQERFDLAVKEILDGYASSMWDVVTDYSEQNYLRSLRRAVAVLPAASLVEASRSLIELQALRKKTSAQQATVGGPIDVGLITPAEGFVWIRHKSIG